MTTTINSAIDQTSVTDCDLVPLTVWDEDRLARRVVPRHLRCRPFLGLTAILDSTAEVHELGRDRHFVRAESLAWLTLQDVPAGWIRDRGMEGREVSLLRLYQTRLQDGMPIVGGSGVKPLHQFDLGFRPREGDVKCGKDTLNVSSFPGLLERAVEMSTRMTICGFETVWRDYAEPKLPRFTYHECHSEWAKDHTKATRELPGPVYLKFERERFDALLGELFTKETKEGHCPIGLHQLPIAIRDAFLADVSQGLPLRAPQNGVFAFGQNVDPSEVHWERDYRTGLVLVHYKEPEDHGGPALVRGFVDSARAETEIFFPADATYQVKDQQIVHTGDVLAHVASVYPGWGNLSQETQVSRIHKVLGSQRRAEEMFLLWARNQALSLDREHVLVPAWLVPSATQRSLDCYLGISPLLAQSGEQVFEPLPTARWISNHQLDGRDLWRHGQDSNLLFCLDPSVDPRFHQPAPRRVQEVVSEEVTA